MRDDEKAKWIGDEEHWAEATDALRRVALASGLKLTEVPGEAAFYGPKIDLKVKDAIGRTWQLSTVQLDFNLPERFDLEFTDRDGVKKRPVMIHRALMGSIERFFAILLEHYAGAFPVWLSPVQVVGIPVAEEYDDYLDEVIAHLRREGVRAEVDHSDDRMQKKIRTHTTQKVPLQLIAGEQDRAGGTVSFRFRDGTQENGVPIDDAVRRIRDAISIAGAGEHGRGSRVTDGAVDEPGSGARSTPPLWRACPDEFQRLWTPHRMAYIAGRAPAAARRVPVLRRAATCRTRTR